MQSYAIISLVSRVKCILSINICCTYNLIFEDLVTVLCEFKINPHYIKRLNRFKFTNYLLNNDKKNEF